MNNIQRGQAAEAILQNPLVNEAFTEIEQALTDAWKESTDAPQREEIYYTLKGLERFKMVFEIAVSTGEGDIALKEKYGE